MIRDDIAKKITREVCIDWERRCHTNGGLYETLEVYPDGTLVEREEPSSNTWHTGTSVLYHTWGNTCNCDWCAEWKHNDNNVQQEFESFDDFIEACICNNDNGSSVEEHILANLSEIPYGFFGDEDSARN